MSGGKKKKSSSGNKNNKKTSGKEIVKDIPFDPENILDNTENIKSAENIKNTESTKKSESSKNAEVSESMATKSSSTTNSTKSTDAFATNPSVDVLDRLAPPILFFPPNVAEEYLNRFCPAPPASSNPLNPENSLLADEGFPDREIPVMRRLLAMMAGIMSKASAASARTYYSRVAGTEGRRNGYFQQNLNTSVFNLFSTLSAAGNPQATESTVNEKDKDLHLTPAAAFTAKDGESLRGYPSRLMKFWRQLSPAEQLRLVKEEHASLTNSWIESRQNWCLCAHCKHRRMTISDLTDCLYQTYCEELEAFLNSSGQGSSLYSPNLTNSMEPAAKARRFLFKSLSVVGEQALLPRYNQFILRLEAFSSMAFSIKDAAGDKNKKKLKIPCDLKNGIKNGLKSAALQASKEFLQRHGGKNVNVTEAEVEEIMNENFLPAHFNASNNHNASNGGGKFNPLEGLSFKVITGSDDEECLMLSNHRSDSEISESEESGTDDDEDERESHQGGIQSEDDDDLIDEETDLPIDESELMLPGGSSFPLLPVGDGPVQWSESSRIECGRTVFLMFASEMFQYRLTAAYLAHQTKLRQLKLLAEVEEEERLEKEKRVREEKEKKEKKEADRKKKEKKKEKAAAKVNSFGTKSKKAQVKKPTAVSVSDTTDDKIVPVPEAVAVDEDEPVTDDEQVVIDEAVAVDVEPVTESMPVPEESVAEPEPAHEEPSPVTIQAEPESVISPQISSPVAPPMITPLFPHTPTLPNLLDDDDFDPTQLVEQLSKEMNRFELYSDKPTSPPGFAPPPGFAAEPKHLDPVEEGYRYNVRPPFAFESVGYHQGYGGEEMYGGGYIQPHSGYQPQPGMYIPPGYAFDPYQQPKQAGNPMYHQNYHPHSGYHHQPYPAAGPPPPPVYPPQHHTTAPPFNSVYRPAPPPPPPPASHYEQDDQQGQSRFQSFFSKSIFGPSSFFSQ